jgi:hypothetical protein
MSEKVSKNLVLGEQMSWNQFEQVQRIKRRRDFVIKLLQGAMRGLAFLHEHDRLHQSLGPSSIVLKYVFKKNSIWFEVPILPRTFCIRLLWLFY